jgi:hypothetical protein
MANKKFGDCAYLYGLDYEDVECITITDISEESSPEFEAEGLDDNGNVAAVVRGEEVVTFTISGFASEDCTLDTYNAGDGGNCTVTLKRQDGGEVKCLVEKFSLNRSNRDFAKVELTAIHYPNAEICCQE